jgi:hypothetical protein
MMARYSNNYEAMLRKSNLRYPSYLIVRGQKHNEVAWIMTWRFRLEIPRNGQRRIFSSLEEVMAAVKTEE